MAELNADGTSINARIVIWGPEGAGKSTNIERIYAKLRPDHRGELRRVPTRLDPTVTFEVLPIELGAIGGLKTTIQILGVPGAPDAAPTRKNLLDKVDGVVLVMDSQRHCLEANVASVQELKQALAAYGRSLKDVPIVIQYNKRDLSDDSAIEALHKKLDLPGAPVFEAIASDGTGVLQTLTTISKQVVRVFRESSTAAASTVAPAAAPARPAPTADAGKTVIQFDTPAPPTTAKPSPNFLASPTSAAKPAAPVRPTPTADAGRTMLQLDDDSLTGAAPASFAQNDLDLLEAKPVDETPTLKIVAVGDATRISEREVRVSLTLQDETGQARPVHLNIRIDDVAQ